MTPQEQQMIDGLIERIRNTQITDRDPVAASHLQQGLSASPDAIYILAQTVLVQQHSLEQAHAQLDQMEAQLRQSQSSGQFSPQGQPAITPPGSGPGNWLSRFFGESAPTPSQQYGQQAAPYAAAPQPTYAALAPGYQPMTGGQQPQYGGPGYAQPGYQQQGFPPQGYPQAPYPQQGYAPQAYPSQGYASSWGQAGGIGGGGSFLRTAAMTAAGVAAGEMLFQGVEGMFGGHHGGYGGSGHEGGPVVNNYYDDREPSEHHHVADTDSSFYNPEHDASRSEGDNIGSQHFADAPSASQSAGSVDSDGFADDSSSGDDDAFDDSSTDDGGSDDSEPDDSSSYDDSSN